MENTAQTIDSTGQVLCDIVLFLFLLVMVIALSNVKPVERGFFCNDQSIMYPFKVDHFDWNMFVALSVIGILVLVMVTEFPHYLKDRKDDSEGSKFSVCGIQVWLYVVQLYKALVPFICAILLNIALVNVLKDSVGRLRPHFMASCRPNITAEMCMEDGSYKYVTDFTCMGSDGFNPVTARESFPSAHTAHTFTCAVYIMLYLQVRMTWQCSHLLRNIPQVALLLLAYYVGASRISTYTNHPTDVLAGALQGTLISLIVGYFFSGLFQKEKVTLKDAPEPSAKSPKKVSFKPTTEYSTLK